MSGPQQFYTVNYMNLQQMAEQLNQHLSNISDRLDANEGRRGTAIVYSDQTVMGQLLVKDRDGYVIAGFVTSTEGLP